MNVKVEAVSKLAKNRLQRTRLEADRDYLVVVRKDDEVDLLVLYGYVRERSALVFELG